MTEGATDKDYTRESIEKAVPELPDRRCLIGWNETMLYNIRPRCLLSRRLSL
jgi:hypothetical protein